MGATFSGETTSVVAAAKDDGILILTPTASADKVIQGNDAAFRVCFTDSSQGTASADYISDNSLATDVAVFYQSDLDYSVGLYKAFETECQAKGITISEVQTFTKDTSTDFSTQISAIKASGAKLVFMPIYAAEAATFLTQAHGKFDADELYFGCDGLDGILTKLSDSSFAENVMGLAPILVEQIFDIIRELHEAGTTILLVEQNAEMALQIADRAYVLESGRITLSGTGQELMASDSIKKAYLGG